MPSLISSLGLPPPPPGAVRAMPVMDITASQGAAVTQGQARAVPVQDADPAAVAKELRDRIAAREKALRKNHRTASAAEADLDKRIAAAPADARAELGQKKKALADLIAGYERELVQLDQDRAAADSPGTSREALLQILARQQSPVGVAKQVEPTIATRKGDLKILGARDQAKTTESAYQDGRATSTTQQTDEALGLLHGYSREDTTTRTVVTAERTTTGQTTTKTTVDASGVAHEKKVSHTTEVDGKKTSTEASRTVQVGPGGASVGGSSKKTAADGSSVAQQRSTGVERGDGKLGIAGSRSTTTTDAAGNEQTTGSTTKAGVTAGPGSVGGYVDHEKKLENKSASGLKTGAVAGLSANVSCKVSPVKGSAPPLFDVVLAIDLGARLALSAGGESKGGKSGSAGVKAGGKVFMNRSHRFDEAQAAAYVAALKSGSGTQQEFAIIRCGLSQGWDAAREMYLAISGQAADPAELDKLKEGESIEVGKQGTVGGSLEVGAKGGLVGASIEGGYEVGGEQSMKVTRVKDGKLEYDTKVGDSEKLSAGAKLGVGVVEGGAGWSTTQTTSTGYKIEVDPKCAKAAEMQAALAACKSQADLDAFARKYPDAVKEKTKSQGQAEKSNVGVGIGGVKLGMEFGSGVSESVKTDGSGKLLEQTVTGDSGGGIEIGIGSLKVGASSNRQAVATVDGEGNAGLDLSKTDKSTDAAKWLEANVPFASDTKREQGAIATAAGAKQETDSTNIAGTQLKHGDLVSLGQLACGSESKWMAACYSPRQLDEWRAAGRKIKAAGGDPGVVATELARFVGGDSLDRGTVIDRALRPTSGDMSGGMRYEFPEGLASRQKDYQALVIADCEAALDAEKDKAKAAAAGQSLVQRLDSLYNAVSSTDGFTKASVKAEMMSATAARKEKVLAKLRVLGGGKADELSAKEKVDRYNALLTNCQRYKQTEDETFAKMQAAHDSWTTSPLNRVIANAQLIKELRGLYTLWDKEYAEMAAIAQEHKLGEGIYWKYKPDRARLAKAEKDQPPGAATAPEPETRDFRQPKQPPAAPVSKDPVGDAHRELQTKRQATATGIEGRLPQAKNKAHGAGNRLHAWIEADPKPAAVDAHNRGMQKLKSAEGFAKKVKPGNVEDLESYGHIAIEDYDAASTCFKEGLGLYPAGSPPKKTPAAA